MAELIGSSGFSRRSFIKGAAVFGTAGMLAGCTPKTDDKDIDDGGKKEIVPSPDVLYPGACSGNCGGGCWLNVHVRDGQVVRTSARDFPNTAYNRICPRGATHVGRIYSAKRLLYPMKRVGARGSGQFERISWDEAINTVTTNWKSITEKYGPQGFGIEWGSGNYQLVHGTCNGVSSLWRLMNMTGASEVPLDVDAGVGFGTSHAHGGLSTVNGPMDIPNAKTIISWGCNPGNALPQIMHFFLERKDAGVKYVVIDPLFDANASRADMWVPVQAGTDGALALGILNELFKNKWVSEDIIKNMTNCPFLVKADGTFVRMSDAGVAPAEGETSPIALLDADTNKLVPFSETTNPVYTGVSNVNGIAVRTAYDIFMESVNKYPAEEASKLCGVSVADIKELARIYHEDGPVRTEMMLGMNHYRNAHYASWPMVLIPMFTGNIGVKGGGCGMLEEYLPQLTLPNYGALYPAGAPGPGRHIPVPNILEATQGGLQGDGIPLKGLFIHGSNPASTFAEHDNTMAWMNNLDFLVVSDMYMTETMSMADIILPAAHWFEKEDLSYLFSTHPYLAWNAKAIEPQGEAKADFEILGLIAKGLGLGDMWPKTSRDYMNEVLGSDYYAAMGITTDNLEQQGAMSLRPGSEDYVASTTTALETGRWYVYQEAVMKSYYYYTDIDESLEHVPQFVEGTFMGQHTDHRAKYPFHAMGEKMRTHTHSQWSECALVREYEAGPVARINPNDAAELGIKEGDNVKLSNEFGHVVMKAALSASVPPKTIVSGRSWNKEDFIDGHFAAICSIGFNQVCANQAFNDASVVLEKA